MPKLIVFLLTVTAFVESQADLNISDYVYWKKEDINQWHKFFPSRVLEEERQTIEAAIEAVTFLEGGLTEDLSKVVAFQYRELQTAHLLMAGTKAEECVNGISNFLDRAIEDQLETYQDCTAYAQSRFSRQNSTLTRVTTSYNTVYQRTLSGIDACARTYPNKNSINRLLSCVESINNNYFTVANTAKSLVSPSPSMSYFRNTVVDCASTAAKAVAAKGSQFLGMLVNCAALSGTVDPTTYAEELDQWKGYNDTLNNQVTVSQSRNYYQVSMVEFAMQNYYNMQKQFLVKYLVESRGLEFYLSKLVSYLQDYYNTVATTTEDNPGESECVTAAGNSLNQTVVTSAAQSVYCDEQIVNNTKRLMAEVYRNFISINLRVPSIGNVAILNCFFLGSIFAPNTIETCFNLGYSEFEADYSDSREKIIEDTSILDEYIATFYNSSESPCNYTSLKRVSLATEKILFDLQRCLYKSSGSTYQVTTPVSTSTATSMLTPTATTSQATTPVITTTTSMITPTETTYGVTTQVSTTTTTSTETPIGTTNKDTPESTTTILPTVASTGTTFEATTPVITTTTSIVTPTETTFGVTTQVSTTTTTSTETPIGTTNEDTPESTTTTLSTVTST